MVAMIALIVLALVVAGMYWLMRRQPDRRSLWRMALYVGAGTGVIDLPIPVEPPLGAQPPPPTSPPPPAPATPSPAIPIQPPAPQPAPGPPPVGLP